MSLPPLVIFDDGQGRWGPLTDLRPVFDLRTGPCTLRQRIERVAGRKAAALFVPPSLHELTQSMSKAPVNTLPPGDAVLLVNGRWNGVTPRDPLETLELNTALVQEDGQVVAAHLSAGDAAAFLQSQRLPDAVRKVNAADAILLQRPWDILNHLDVMTRADIAKSELPSLNADMPHIATIGDHVIRMGSTAKLHPRVTINSEKGPVVIDEHAIIGSFTVIAGPCYIGRNTVITPFTHVRSNMVIGPYCVVGGEVSYSVLQGYANKCHSGYLGNAFVGEWVNLGADTTASNLKNTYNSVRMMLDDDGEEDSGRDKLGPVIGDYVRTAIGTRINTGSCLMTGTMLALSGFAPKYTDRFAFHTDKGVDKYDIEKFLDSAGRMMSRRERTINSALEARLRSLAA